MLVAMQSQHYLPRYSRGGQIGFDTVTIIGKVEYIAFILNRGREVAGLGIQRHQRYYIRVVVGILMQGGDTSGIAKCSSAK
jgi:hypothetical protein